MGFSHRGAIPSLISLVLNISQCFKCLKVKFKFEVVDAVLIANEVVDEKRRSGEEGVVFKIDFEKAYDHVDWGFLDHVLQRKGFSQK